MITGKNSKGKKRRESDNGEELLSPIRPTVFPGTLPFAEEQLFSLVGPVGRG